MSKVLLLVEDDFFIWELYQRVLEAQGFDVLTASDGEEAIEIFEDSNADLVLLDLMLPKVNGIDVIRHIRSLGTTQKKTPVVVISNLSTPEAMDEVMKLGVEDYWIKSEKTPADIVEGINHYVL